MRKTALVLISVLLLAFSSCQSGPRYLSTKADDWRNNHYESSPLGTAFLTDVIPFYPLVTLLASIPDYLVLNPIQFWVIDVWRDRGVAAMHNNPEGGEDPWFVRNESED